MRQSQHTPRESPAFDGIQLDKPLHIIVIDKRQGGLGSQVFDTLAIDTVGKDRHLAVVISVNIHLHGVDFQVGVSKIREIH